MQRSERVLLTRRTETSLRRSFVRLSLWRGMVASGVARASAPPAHGRAVGMNQLSRDLPNTSNLVRRFLDRAHRLALFSGDPILCACHYCLLIAVGLAGRAIADDNRVFSVHVDGKDAGQYQVRVTEKDGTTECTVAARVRVKTLIGNYRYSLDSQEVWKDGKLTGLRSSADDDGTKHDVTLTTADGVGTLKADGKEKRVNGPVWPTTYWQLPKAVGEDGAVTLVDSDTGKLIRAKLKKVGADKIRLLGKEQDVTKYRLSGGVDVTLWYDGGGRLVRESFKDSGYQTVLELTELSDK